MLVTVGRVGRAHGIRGEVTVLPRTDDPGTRLAAGAVLVTEPATAGPLRVERSRWHSGRMLVAFAGVTDRAAAESLRGVLLQVDVAEQDVPEEPDSWYDHQLVGLEAVTVGGQPVGTVVDVLHLPGQDLLVVRREGAAEALVPFVAAIVPEVDLAGGRVVLEPPPGLLDPEPAETTRPAPGNEQRW